MTRRKILNLPREREDRLPTRRKISIFRGRRRGTS
jgi:hypothetical protein